MAKLTNYTGSVELISGIKQKNNGDFPLLEANAIQVNEDGKRLDEVIGTLDELQTTNKSSLVAAINEVKNTSSGNDDVGSLDNLQTTDKSSVVAAVNEVKGETAELKSDLVQTESRLSESIVEISGLEPITGWTENAYITNGGMAVGEVVNVTPRTYSNVNCIVLACVEGDAFTLDAVCTGNASRTYAFLDNEYRLLVNSVKDEDIKTTVYAPKDSAFIIINNVRTDSNSFKGEKRIDLIEDSIITIKNSIDGVIQEEKNKWHDYSDGYVSDTGAIFDGGTSYKYLFVAVKVGETIKCNSPIRFYSWFDVNKNYCKSGGASITAETPIISLVNGYIAISIAIAYVKNTIVTINNENATLLDTYPTTYVDTRVKGITFDSECPTTLKVGTSMKAYMTFNAFSNVYFGQYSDDGFNWKIVVTPTKLQAINSSGAVTTELEHGLNIKDFLFIQFDKAVLGTQKIRIKTNGGEYTRDWHNATDFRQPYRFETSNTIVYQNVSNHLLNNDIWFFGDSYWSNSDSRIYGQLTNMGLKDLCVMAYPGAKSADMYEELEKALKLSTPRKIVWCCGMNDLTLNDYLITIDKIVEICKEKRIEIVLTTIPPVPNKSTVNNSISARIREYGLPYIENAYAVAGTTLNENWFEGMLSSDKVHPTEEGAKVLAYMVMQSVPEITKHMEY